MVQTGLWLYENQIQWIKGEIVVIALAVFAFVAIIMLGD